jgi:lysophospholipase L1-like esterase
VSRLRLVWGLFLVLAGVALLPAPGPAIPLIWLLSALPGSLALARRANDSRLPAALAELTSTPGDRIRALVLAALFVAVAMIFSPAAALFGATILGSALLWAAGRRGAGPARGLLDHTTLSCVVVALVLVPVDLVLQLPVFTRRFGLPAERIRQEELHDRLWERNVFGFRSPHEQVARRPGIRRILAIGDSFTWGLYIPDSDSTWPARLERRLGDGVEVINMGQRGWTTANEAEFLRRLGWQFDPDLVLVQYYLNDTYDSGPDFEYRQGPQVYVLPDLFARGYVRHSALVWMAAGAVTRLRYGTQLQRVEAEGRYRPGSPAWRQLSEGLRQIGDSARARGTPVLFVLFPDLAPGRWTPATYPARAIHQQVAREARTAGLHVLDLTGAFAAEGGDWKRWWVLPYDSHPNAAAYELAARAIAGEIEKRDLLRVSARTPPASPRTSPPPARSP